MLTQEIIIRRREKQTLAGEHIKQFVDGIASGDVSDAQIAAFCMTVCLNPLQIQERIDLTLAMARSGMTLDWSNQNLNGPVLDKHSTGGIGDKTSLILAPIIAACGGYVPMLSGRGLGHTGGTLDKLDAIPGYKTQPDLQTMKSVVKSCGLAIIGATKDLAPADRAMYAVRDISGTVESLDLITASILSKKLAAGLSGLVMDVKYGSGAFMEKYADARALGESIATVANGAGLPCVALMTDMDQALGTCAGNAIEVREAIQFLRNETIDQRLYTVTIELCAELLVLGKLAGSMEAARDMAKGAIASGKAAEKFSMMIAALGGPADLIEKPHHYLPLAETVHEIHPPENGVVTAINVRKLGYAIIALGGGRQVAGDAIDYGTGLDNIAGIGESVGPGARPLCTVIGRNTNQIAAAESLIREAFVMTPGTPNVETKPPIRERLVT